jgi:hypothetical protein
MGEVWNVPACAFALWNQTPDRGGTIQPISNTAIWAFLWAAPLCARCHNDQPTLPMQNRALREYAAWRGWTVAIQIREVGSGAVERKAREQLIEAARRPTNRCGARMAPGSMGTIRDGSAREELRVLTVAKFVGVV